jgi:1-acyl-sn-glycerol-3-phosphate acyltransferase
VERPVRTVVGFAGIALGAAVVHRVHFDRSPSIPRTGPAIVVANHLATTETLALARLVTGHRRFPHFLVMAEAFAWPAVGRVLRAARQIPVLRGSTDAVNALAAADRELQAGHVVVLYPEGRVTRDPDLWPGPGRTGVARLALEHPDVPLVPVGQWGARPGRRHPWHRHAVRLLVGEPVDLSPWAGRTDHRATREATDAVMAEIRRLVAQLRGESAPPPPGPTRA